MQSSLQVAIILSLKGDQARSRTGAEWPSRIGWVLDIRPTSSSLRTRNGPPPPPSMATAKNFGLTQQKLESQAERVTLTSLKHLSPFSGVPKM